MLPINLPDSIAISTLIIAVLAAWRGAVKGEEARRISPPSPAVSVIGGLVDSAAMQDLVEAVRDLADTLRDGAYSRAQSDSDRMTELLEEIRDRLDHPVAASPPVRR